MDFSEHCVIEASQKSESGPDDKALWLTRNDDRNINANSLLFRTECFLYLLNSVAFLFKCFVINI